MVIGHVSEDGLAIAEPWFSRRPYREVGSFFLKSALISRAVSNGAGGDNLNAMKSPLLPIQASRGRVHVVDFASSYLRAIRKLRAWSDQ